MIEPKFNLPWHVVFVESVHRKDSPSCKEICAKGSAPIRIDHTTPEEAMRFCGDSSNTELHVFLTDSVEDIIDATGSHIFCSGHDYDDYGSIDVAAARHIVRVVNLHEKLVEALKRISSLDPSVDSAEGFNEWGEAECFRLAKESAEAALKLAREGM